jgi:NAD(P)-dependent dehydrogenase (short-subunit alcohol dehydrogenase family)
LATELVRYDGAHAVVTGAASGIGARVAEACARLGARVTGLDRQPLGPGSPLTDFIGVDLADAESVTAAAAAVPGDVDVVFNVAGVSSGIGDPLAVVTINFLGTRAFTEALLPRLNPGGAVVNVSSLAARNYRDNAAVTTGLLDTATMDDGINWCRDNPAALADGGYRLSKEAVILWGMRLTGPLGARDIRINAVAPGVTDTPILDQLRSAYGPQFLDTFAAPLGRNSEPGEQADVLLFLGSRAASYLTGQVIWVDGGILGDAWARELTGEPR